MEQYRIVARGDARDSLGEGLLWSARDNALYWTDILGMAVNRLSMRDQAFNRWPVTEPIGWVIERAEGDFIAGLKTGFYELSLSPLSLRPIINPHPKCPNLRMNDAKADWKGRIWAGSMSVNADQPTGVLYRLDPDRSLHAMDDGYYVANGPTFSLDQKSVFHADTKRGLVYRYSLLDNGSVGHREIVIRFEEGWGLPDGMTTDAEGHLWIAHWGGGRVSRFTPDGELELSVPLPATNITNVCFAGPKLDRMFVTSAANERPTEPNAGCLFEILRPGVTGIAAGQFAG